MGNYGIIDTPHPTYPTLPRPMIEVGMKILDNSGDSDGVDKEELGNIENTPKIREEQAQWRSQFTRKSEAKISEP